MLKRGPFPPRQLYPIAVSLAVCSLVACTANTTPFGQSGHLSAGAVASQRYLQKPTGPVQQNLTEGIAALTQGNATKANQAFNTAISLDMHNAALHTANALAYQIRSRHGERDLFELAETGFLIALEQQHDSQNAVLQLAHLYLENKQYKQAQLAAAYALKLDAADPESLQLLASASYYLGETELALWAIQRLQNIAPLDATTSRIAPLIYSSAGLTADAMKLYQSAQQNLNAQDQQKLSQRLTQWQNSYQLNDTNQLPHEKSNIVSLLQPAASVKTADASGPLMYAWSDCVQRLTPVAETSETDSGSDDSTTQGVAVDETKVLPSLPSPCLGRPLPQMAVIDVVILRNNQLNTSSTGLNLLDNLAVSIQNTTNKITTTTSGEPGVTNTTLTRDIGLGTSAGGAIAYSLNIANVTEQTTEVVARPSLLVLDRQSAQFFSGSNIAVGLAGSDGGSSSFNQINVGVSLSVTPTFIDDEHMLLNVKAARTFFEPITGSSTFSQSVQTSRNTVSAASSVKVNETLILSGLVESEVISGSSGVPLIKDIPGVKNLFSRNTQQSYKKSVLILITPRRVPSYDRTLQGAETAEIQAEEPAETIKELRQFAHKELGEKWPDLMARTQPMSRKVRAFNARTNDIQLDDWFALPRMQNILQEVTEP
ncbi:type II secretory pathway, component PulD [Rheinheimera sp. A13L]|uniref:type II secretory pathway, component PulD n=1 Tax=Rheinheimera sp. A13L TaxID=506534 RepID=UPI00021256E6|nr:type II secretory pathway, component PulD [Rheinheimera sp. A13L]EGM77400.1 type II secretory pathway, component PulD [Rheinheimera sp. A13L]